jgi:hypothetical protein
MKKWFAIVGALVACGGSVVDLGGRPGASQDDGGAPSGYEDALSSDDGAPPFAPLFTGEAGTCPYPVQSSACVYTGACSDGSGYFAYDSDLYLASCTKPTGAPASFTSAAQVSAALVGMWVACGEATFLGPLDANATGIQFTSDGHFTVLATSTTKSLVTASSGADSGTFDVVDASASLGPGTYQVRLSASNGGVYTTQVVVVGPAPTLRFFAPAANDYAPALSKRFQAGVCGAPLGPIDTPSSGADALARMQGSWVLCSSPKPDQVVEGPLPGEGLEFTADGTLYFLFENADGVLARNPSASVSQVSVKVAGSSPASLMFTAPDGTGFALQPILGSCGTLGFTVGAGQSPYTETYFRMP